LEEASLEADTGTQLTIPDGNRGLVTDLTLGHDTGRLAEQFATGVDDDSITGYIVDNHVLTDFNTLGIGYDYAFF